MSDNLDRMLRNLGEGSPFPVDWRAYEQEVLRRLMIAQHRQRRRTWMLTLGGAVSGAAAMFVASVIWFGSTPPATKQERIQPAKIDAPRAPEAAPSSEPPVQRATEGPTLALAEKNTDLQPCTRRIVTKNGRVAEIRFEGFTSSPRPGGQSSFITVSDRSSH